MNEDQQQQQSVLYFNNKYKHLRGRLFRTENKTTSNAKGLGLVKGVADLQFILDNGCIAPIELKAYGSRHKVKHLQHQLDWLKQVKKLSGHAYFCFSVDEFKELIDRLVFYKENELWLLTESVVTIEHIEKLINKANEKGIESVKIESFK
jgi:hypothetical protein